MRRPCQTEPNLTRGQNIISLQDARRRQIVDNVLETDVFEHWAKRCTFICVQEGLFLTQVCGPRANKKNSQTSECDYQQTAKKDLMWRYYFIRCGLIVPVLRLQSQASASARSCLMGPSHDGLSCRNIHYRETKLWRFFFFRVHPWVKKYITFPSTFFRAVYTSISTCMTNRSEDWMSCSITSALQTQCRKKMWVWSQILHSGLKILLLKSEVRIIIQGRIEARRWLRADTYPSSFISSTFWFVIRLFRSHSRHL